MKPNIKNIVKQRNRVIKQLEVNVSIYTSYSKSYPSGETPMGGPKDPTEAPTEDYGEPTIVPCVVRYLSAESLERRRLGNIKHAVIELFCSQIFEAIFKSAAKISYDDKLWQVYKDDTGNITIKKIRNFDGSYDRIQIILEEKLSEAQ